MEIYSYGWVCPRCGKVLAPHVKECDCRPEPKSNINGSFYKTIESSGMCRGVRHYTWCPEEPRYITCHTCPDWIECVPV